MSPFNLHELGLSSLVYVSRSSLALNGDNDAVDEIVSIANSHNRTLRMSGALIYTELHFAQLLEGPACAIDELMRSIRRDERHCDVTVVAEQKISTRKFKDWAMAYSGPSPYLDRYIKRLISPATAEEERLPLVEHLITFMQRLDTERTQIVSR